MFHACLVSALLCFVHTLRCFYMFYGTNILTRCHSASFLFSSVFGSRKASKEIFSELDGTKAKVNISPRRTRSPEERRRGATGRPHPQARAHPGPRLGPLDASQLASSPIRIPRCLNPKHPINIPRNR